MNFLVYICNGLSFYSKTLGMMHDTTFAKLCLLYLTVSQFSYATTANNSITTFKNMTFIKIPATEDSFGDETLETTYKLR